MSRRWPRAGADYPGSYADLLSWFPDDAACLDYLDWLRWPDGFACPHCGGTRAWRLADGRWSCGGCARRVSPTAGTIFHATRTPLTVWFVAAWHMTSQKHGISALGLKRVLGIGSEQTAWAMLRRFRTAMVRPGRERLGGTVEVDETFLGGPEPDRPGRGALGKTMVEVAVIGDTGSAAADWPSSTMRAPPPCARSCWLTSSQARSSSATAGRRTRGPAGRTTATSPSSSRAPDPRPTSSCPASTGSPR